MPAWDSLSENSKRLFAHQNLRADPHVLIADPCHLLGSRPGRPLRLADRNVAKNASPPHPRKREPDPPSPDQAARLLNLVRAEDEEFGLYLWTAFTTGARRGEVSALRENRFDFTSQQVRLARNYLVSSRRARVRRRRPVAAPPDQGSGPGYHGRDARSRARP